MVNFFPSSLSSYFMRASSTAVVLCSWLLLFMLWKHLSNNSIHSDGWLLHMHPNKGVVQWLRTLIDGCHSDAIIDCAWSNITRASTLSTHNLSYTLSPLIRRKISFLWPPIITPFRLLFPNLVLASLLCPGYFGTSSLINKSLLVIHPSSLLVLRAQLSPSVKHTIQIT